MSKVYTSEEIEKLEKGAIELVNQSNEKPTIKTNAAAWFGFALPESDVCCVAESAQTWRGSKPTETFRFKFHKLNETGNPKSRGRIVARAKITA